jgi:hypothetical protein
VRAGKIKAIAQAPELDGIAAILEGADGDVRRLVHPNVVARGWPQVGDYLVEYDDGYVSWSPAKAFEDGYSRIKE